MKWAIAAIAVALALGTMARAAEEEVLYCTDTDVNGFFWDNGEAKRAGFESSQLVVSVLPNGNRFIEKRLYKCSPLWPSAPDLLSCKFPGSVVDLWIFRGMNYTRAYLFGENLGGDPNIAVAYGTCTDF
jgi:hypothetical protein